MNLMNQFEEIMDRADGACQARAEYQLQQAVRDAHEAGISFRDILQIVADEGAMQHIKVING